MKTPVRLIATVAIAALTLTSCSADDGMDADADAAGPSTTSDVGSPDIAPAPDQDLSYDDDAAAEAPADAFDEADEPGHVAPEPETERPGIESVVFDDHGVSGWNDTGTQPMSTFQTDADVASFRIAESWLSTGVLPPPEAVRAEEWINALDHDHPAPDGAEVWRVTADAADPWWQSAQTSPERTRLVRVGLQATDTQPRPPASITFVVDISGSMSYDDRLDALVDVIGDFTTTLGEQDQVGVVTFSDHADVLVEHTNDFAHVRDRLATLRPTNATNTGAGVILGHEQAARAHREGDSSSVVVLADGMANEGIVEGDLIVAELDRIEAPARIVTHTVGIGREVYNDALLEQLANVSGGTYAYIDGPQHAERLFHRDLPLLNPVAHDVKAQVAFDPAVVRSWRLIGYENRMIAAEDFRDDAVSGSYVGAGHAVTALYEVDVAAERPGDAALGTVHVRWADPTTRQVSEIATPLPASLVTQDTTSTTFAAAAGMAALTEALRLSPHSVVDLDAAAQRLDTAGSAQDRWLAGLVREAAAVHTPTQRTEAPTP